MKYKQAIWLASYPRSGNTLLRTARRIVRSSSPDTWAHGSNAGEMVRDVRFRMRLRLPGARTGSESGGTDGTAPTDPEPLPPTRVSFSWRADDESVDCSRCSGCCCP